jgi:hypothetical protein
MEGRISNRRCVGSSCACTRAFRGKRNSEEELIKEKVEMDLGVTTFKVRFDDAMEL